MAPPWCTGWADQIWNEFPEIERYRAAEKLVNFADANPQVLKADTSAQRAFLADLKRKQRVDVAVGTNAAGKRARYPEHWTWKSVRARAGSLGQEAMYVEVYPLLSWYVHAGATGTAGMNKGDLESMFGFCHSVIQRIFVDATATCATTTKISSLDYFSGWMTSIKLKTREFIVTEQIKLLEAKRKQAAP